MDWTNVVALSGSGLALLGVAMGSYFSATTERRHWSYTGQIDACTAFLAEYSAVYLAYAKAVGTPAALGKRTTTGFVDWEPFNRALEVLNLKAETHIVQAAHDADRALWEVGLRLTRGRLPEDQWKEARVPLEAARLAFVNAVREQLGQRGAPLRSLHGRPTDGDPVWSGG